MKTKEAGSYKVRPHALVSTDDATMYADFIASVPEVDREDEVIHPEDFNTSEWERNPIWLWAHDKSKPPIGAGYRPDGSIAVDQTAKRLILGCKFSQANPQGALTYALYKEGTLKMVSVGFLSTAKPQILDGKMYGHPRMVTRIMEPELVECSCVPIGMNRSAMLLSIKRYGDAILDAYVNRDELARVLDMGHLHGEKVPEDMRRDLEPFAAKSRWKAAVVNKIPKFSSQPTQKGLALSPTGDTAVASIASKVPLKGGKVPEVATKQASAEPPSSQVEPEVTLSAGAQTYKAMMEAAVGLAKGGVEMGAQSDNPEVIQSIKAHASYFAAGVKRMYQDAMKYFDANKDIFAESATLAAQYEILAEEPDAAMPNTEDEVAIQEDVEVDKAEDGPEVPGDKTDPEPEEEVEVEEEDDKEPEKAVDVVITKAMFAEWETQKFAELTERIAELEAKLEAVSDIAVDLVGVR